uniref:Uncharacterized protein n=1 Tax=Rousettus aegyptiacus TaxID=9407 RepID=A0A7J8IL95_ROUAE|nr:hypothetical protein HJG63_007205 [Rousettus aegyptiacus]
MELPCIRLSMLYLPTERCQRRFGSERQWMSGLKLFLKKFRMNWQEKIMNKRNLIRRIKESRKLIIWVKILKAISKTKP